MELVALPRTFAAVMNSLPEGFTISDRVLDPVIVLSRFGNRIVASLAGRRVVRGQSTLFPAPSLRHSWVVDGTTIRPLPSDASDLVARVFRGADPDDLPYAKAVDMIRSVPDGLTVEADPVVLHSGRAAAEQLSEKLELQGVEATLFPYQARGVQWMWETVNRTGGLILADEMGLGKTLQIIALLMMQPPAKTSPALIVCPTSLIANWVREFRRFAPSLTVLVHRGPHRAGIFPDLQISQAVITTYDTMLNDIGLISSFEWSWVICDEAQAIKNPHSARRQAIAAIPRRRSIPMTGTPVENRLLDLWSIADFAIPGILGPRSCFEVEFPDTVDAGQALRGLMDPIMLKRRVADVASDLPERIEIDLPLELDDELAQHYDAVRAATLAKYSVAGALVATLQLQLVCAHPWLRVPDTASDQWDDASIDARAGIPLVTPKIERVTDLLREAFSNGRKVIIFAMFNRIGDLVRQASTDMKTTWWGAINGSTPSERRQPLVDEFSAFDGPACLVLNPKAAGTGLNITAATVVIHFTPVWNPAVEAQASARAHRRGQTEPVTIYRLFYKGTVEEVMNDRSAWKQDLANETVPVSSRDAEDLRRALQISPSRPEL